MLGCQLIAEQSLLDNAFYLEFKSKLEDNAAKIKELNSVDANNVNSYIVALDDE